MVFAEALHWWMGVCPIARLLNQDKNASLLKRSTRGQIKFCDKNSVHQIAERKTYAPLFQIEKPLKVVRAMQSSVNVSKSMGLRFCHMDFTAGRDISTRKHELGMIITAM